MTMRRKSRQLSAVTGKARVEYFVPASVADAIAGRDSYAFCHPNVERMVKDVRYLAQKAEQKAASAAGAKERIETLRSKGYDEAVITREAKKKAAAAKRAAKSGNVFADLVKQIEADVERLRARGVTGDIPACVNRTTGRTGARPRPERRATAVHERFHADVRRVEIDGGLRTPYFCADAVQRKLEPELTPKLLAYSRARYSSGQTKAAAEELLARVEELRKACRTKRASKDCAATEEKVTRMMPADVKEEFMALRRKVESQYGTPLNVFRAALPACTKWQP